jgi:NAD(P)-dependent dehydrogenase (short-subunit alcohol dehydrogenase family)
MTIIQRMLPLLRKSSSPLVVNMSSSLGSIAENKTGCPDSVRYRCTKAALNMLTKTFSVQTPDVTFISMHPGWVATDMGAAGNRAPPLTVEQSCTGMSKVITSTTSAQTGHFLAFDGSELPW